MWGIQEWWTEETWSLSVASYSRVLLVIMLLQYTFVIACVAVVPVVIVAISLGGYQHYLSDTL